MKDKFISLEPVQPSLDRVYYYHGDHLNSSTYVTDDIERPVAYYDYLPFGETMVEHNQTTNFNNGYKFNAKELDEATGMSYYGARYYDSRLSVFVSVDPLAEKYRNIGGYVYTANNPINFIDPDGEEVKITFNKSTRKLLIIDLDHYKKYLPTKYVSAKDYVQGGIRDKNGKLTHNQVLVIENVFSGGKSVNGIVERDPKRPQQKPLPNGNYDLLDNNSDTKHIGWYRLDKQDSSLYNDRDDDTGRDGFRLHLGTESWGCITCDTSKENRYEEWEVLTKILDSTTTSTVPEKRGRQRWNIFSKRIKYGTVEVIGKDNIETKNVKK
ncbi:RHS repeat domain-containing protein [Capnocytophaga sp. ARDL2]|uniref:RHS repeat domain-containing protein n=1 Tax=Capnocytophaga sp. ARDL2 TaxID=3238809 RepID=UPI003556BF6C